MSVPANVQGRVVGVVLTGGVEIGAAGVALAELVVETPIDTAAPVPIGVVSVVRIGAQPSGVARIGAPAGSGMRIGGGLRRGGRRRMRLGTNG